MLSHWNMLLDLPAEIPDEIDTGKRKRAYKDEFDGFLSNWKIEVTSNQNGNVEK